MKHRRPLPAGDGRNIRLLSPDHLATSTGADIKDFCATALIYAVLCLGYGYLLYLVAALVPCS